MDDEQRRKPGTDGAGNGGADDVRGTGGVGGADGARGADDVRSAVSDEAGRSATEPAAPENPAPAQGTPAKGSSRAPAGAAVLRDDVTAAIRTAVIDELATVGYGRMSIERIARRAGVGKAAVYRRWRSKLPIVLDVMSTLATQGMPTPDTGSLPGDIRALLSATARLLEHPTASQILPDLLAEAARNPDIAEAVQTAVRDSQRGIAETVIANAVARGELPAGTDVDLALDLASGPLYWRLVMTRTPLPEGYLETLTHATTAAVTAAHPRPAAPTPASGKDVPS